MAFLTWLINLFKEEDKKIEVVKREELKERDYEAPVNKKFWKTSDKGINFIKRFEGFKTKAYKCPAGKWTIGYGFTKDVKKGDTMSKWGATKRLKQELFEFEIEVNELVGNLIGEQYQFDALISFVYNIGVPKFKKSSLLRYLTIANFSRAAKQFRRWTYANGKELNGLIKRREAEKNLFLDGSY